MDSLRAIAAAHSVSVEALAAAVDAEEARRAAERKQRRVRAVPANRYSAIRDGSYTPQRRPWANGQDRAYVGAALRRWRLVHGLSQRQAQARIGYAVSSQTWHMWETNVAAPPYRALLLIIAATGFGHVADDLRRPTTDTELERMASDHRELLRARRES